MDLRIEKTYRSLVAAFTRLLETHRYEDVTVAMLCDEAMIRRTTFYKHFADKTAFFSFFADSLRINFLKTGEAHAAQDEGAAILQSLIDFMLEHEALVDNIFQSSMSGMMMTTMAGKVAEAIRERYRASFASREGGAAALGVVSEFAAGGIVRLLEVWWASGHREHDERALVASATALVDRVLG